MGPFEEHLRDAIHINQERAPRYSRLSNGRSLLVSRMLLVSEKASLPFSRIPDWRAKKFNLAGIPIVKEEFIPMSETPPFNERFPFEPLGLFRFKASDASRIAAGVLKGYRLAGFEGASAAAAEAISSLGEDKTFHSMMRHVLESVIRVSNLAPMHEKRRKEVGFPQSTLPLSKWLFFSHFSAFPFSSWLDSKAAPLQAEGIPILFQDVPPIPAHSDFYSGFSTR